MGGNPGIATMGFDTPIPTFTTNTATTTPTTPTTTKSTSATNVIDVTTMSATTVPISDGGCGKNAKSQIDMIQQISL